MADRFAYLYKKLLKVPDFQRQFDIFTQNGIELINPSTDSITSISEYGEQLVVTAAWLSSQVTAKQTVSWQWWLDGSTDIYCRSRVIGDVLVEEYGLDGLGERIEWVDLVLLRWFLVSIKDRTALGVVIDNEGATEDFDWDRFFLQDGGLGAEFPTLLGLRSEEKHRIGTIPARVSTRSVEEFVLFSRLERLFDALL